ALGGAIYIGPAIAGTPSLLLKHATVAYNNASNGPGGAPGGSAGDSLVSNGGGLYANDGELQFWNSIIADNMGDFGSSGGGGSGIQNCLLFGNITLTNDNLENSGAIGGTCTFDVNANPNFAPQVGGNDAYSWGGNGLPVVMPLAPSPAINGAAVHGINTGGCALGVDERGAERPLLVNVGGTFHHAACDLGAVQNDIIFRNGLDN
ncbi:MAG: hypothetical protein WBW92_13840, partial [Rhodanobacteraceae bacterium]